MMVDFIRYKNELLRIDKIIRVIYDPAPPPIPADKPRLFLYCATGEPIQIAGTVADDVWGYLIQNSVGGD